MFASRKDLLTFFQFLQSEIGTTDITKSLKAAIYKANNNIDEGGAFVIANAVLDFEENPGVPKNNVIPFPKNGRNQNVY